MTTTIIPKMRPIHPHHPPPHHRRLHHLHRRRLLLHPTAAIEASPAVAIAQAPAVLVVVVVKKRKRMVTRLIIQTPPTAMSLTIGVILGTEIKICSGLIMKISVKPLQLVLSLFLVITFVVVGVLYGFGIVFWYFSCLFCSVDGSSSLVKTWVLSILVAY